MMVPEVTRPTPTGDRASEWRDGDARTVATVGHGVLVDGVGADADARRDARRLRSRRGLRLRAAGRADQRPDRLRAPLPAEDQAGPGPRRQPDLGRGRGLRPRL